MRSNRFLITVLVALIVIAFGMYFIFVNFPPNTFLFVLILILSGFAANILGALIFYTFARPIGLETNRDLFRRCYRKSLWIGILVVLMLIIQVYFDLL